MSYDGYIQIDGEDVDYLGNYTSNVSRMWSTALEEVTGKPMRLQDTRGMNMDDAASLLQAAANVMRNNRATYEVMNPENGWGDYEGAVRYLENAATHCQWFRQTAVIRWSA